MDNNILKIIFRVVAVLLSLGALFFQLINFVLGLWLKMSQICKMIIGIMVQNLYLIYLRLLLLSGL